MSGEAAAPEQIRLLIADDHVLILGGVGGDNRPAG